MSDDTGLAELLKDAESCHRLTDWEEEFCSDMRDRVRRFGDDVHLSDAQEKVLRRIESKVYAA